LLEQGKEGFPVKLVEIGVEHGRQDLADPEEVG
jgi:hypothetical protein